MHPPFYCRSGCSYCWVFHYLPLLACQLSSKTLSTNMMPSLHLLPHIGGGVQEVSPRYAPGWKTTDFCRNKTNLLVSWNQENSSLALLLAFDPSVHWSQYFSNTASELDLASEMNLLKNDHYSWVQWIVTLQNLHMQWCQLSRSEIFGSANFVEPDFRWKWLSFNANFN